MLALVLALANIVSVGRWGTNHRSGQPTDISMDGFNRVSCLESNVLSQRQDVALGE
jgi:hypothetical protein